MASTGILEPDGSGWGSGRSNPAIPWPLHQTPQLESGVTAKGSGWKSSEQARYAPTSTHGRLAGILRSGPHCQTSTSRRDDRACPPGL